MPGPAPKPADKRQRRNKKNNIVLMPDRGVVATPDPPKGLLKNTLAQWDKYWGSQLAQATEIETDLPAITRLFTLYDERERAYRAFRKQRFIKGSQGQIVLNPIGRHMNTLDAEIRQMEDRLGLTPRSRLQLGITFADAAKSLEDLNESLNIDEIEDPR